MKQLNKWIGNLTITIGALVLVLMVLQIVIDVAMRNLMGTGFPATADLVSKYYMVAVSFLPIAYAELRDRHIEATVFTDRLPYSLKQVVLVFGYLLTLVVYAVLGWGTLQDALVNTSKGAYIELGTALFYTWPGYWILPVSFGLMLLVSVLRLVGAATAMITRSQFGSEHDPVPINVTLSHGEKH